jgi:hypothetical protein
MDAYKKIYSERSRELAIETILSSCLPSNGLFIPFCNIVELRYRRFMKAVEIVDDSYVDDLHCL